MTDYEKNGVKITYGGPDNWKIEGIPTAEQIADLEARIAADRAGFVGRAAAATTIETIFPQEDYVLAHEEYPHLTDKDRAR